MFLIKYLWKIGYAGLCFDSFDCQILPSINQKVPNSK